VYSVPESFVERVRSHENDRVRAEDVRSSCPKLQRDERGLLRGRE